MTTGECDHDTDAVRKELEGNGSYETTEGVSWSSKVPADGTNSEVPLSLNTVLSLLDTELATLMEGSESTERRMRNDEERDHDSFPSCINSKGDTIRCEKFRDMIRSFGVMMSSKASAVIPSQTASKLSTL
jgi:hypothetical protein